MKNVYGNLILTFLLSGLFNTACFGSDSTFTKITIGSVVTDGGDSRSVNWIDIDNDGYLDLFISNGSPNTSVNFLYHNNGDGTFTKITTGNIVTDIGGFDGATWGDYDNDGKGDLFVVTWYNQRNALYHGNGDGSFTKVTTGSIATDQTYSETASWGDYDNDGFVDLYVANSEGIGGDRRNYLYHNNGDGSFTRITTGSPLVTDNEKTRSITWVDYDNDGFLDLFVTNEGNLRNSLYHNNGNGTFTKITTGDIVNNSGDSFGSSWGDYDNDGFLDLFVANFSNQNNFLYHNNGDGTFTRITTGAIVNDGGYSIGSAWGDYDNDGFLDLFVTNGYGYNGSTPVKLVNFLYHNNGDGTFTRITTGDVAADSGWAYGCAWGDYNRDGFLDLAVARLFNNTENNSLYLNRGNSNKWLTVKCVGTVSNKFALGAKVKVKAVIGGVARWQLRQVSGQSGYCGQNLESHFGLGSATTIDSVRIEYPSGIVQVLTNVTPNQVLTVTEPMPAGYVRANFSADVKSGNTPLTVQFKDLSVANPASPVTSWKWDFNNDGIIDAQSQNPTFTFTQAGTYAVRLIVSNGVKTDTLTRAAYISTSTVGVPKDGKPLKSGFQLEQNYPNPFNPSTVISYQLSVSSQIILKVFDVLGREVATLVNEKKQAGQYDVAFDASKLSSGVYFYKLIASGASGDFIQTKKMLLAK